jgi:hypothetical protein
MSYDPRDYRPESQKADCGHLFAGPRLECLCKLEFCAIECLAEHRKECPVPLVDVDCPYDHEPDCTCIFQGDEADSTMCEFHNLRSGWRLEVAAWERQQEEVAA